MLTFSLKELKPISRPSRCIVLIIGGGSSTASTWLEIRGANKHLAPTKSHFKEAGLRCLIRLDLASYFQRAWLLLASKFSS